MPIDVLIIGAGPAGYTAAIYAARAMLKPVVLTGPVDGGQLTTTTDVENFPGYPAGVSGPDLMTDLRKQAEKFGAKVVSDYVTAIKNDTTPFEVECGQGIITAHSIIVATGATARWLGAEGEERVKGNGVSTCATCDGAFFKGEELIVVGGGDSAMEEALFLTRYATKVTIVHRRTEFRASKIMLERAKTHPKIEWKTNAVVKEWEFILDDYGTPILKGAVLSVNRKPETLKCGGAFIAIGHVPATKFLHGILKLNTDGYIINSQNMMTSVPGIFSCGDVCDSSSRYKQAITAAGEGCKAAMDCEKWLESTLL